MSALGGQAETETHREGEKEAEDREEMEREKETGRQSKVMRRQKDREGREESIRDRSAGSEPIPRPPLVTRAGQQAAAEAALAGGLARQPLLLAAHLGCRAGPESTEITDQPWLGPGKGTPCRNHVRAAYLWRHTRELENVKTEK